MYFRYGSYTHPAGEVNLARYLVREKKSNRGRRISLIHTMFLEGEICAYGQAAITARIEQLIDTYSVNYQDAALYQDDGQPTPHSLFNGRPDCISGVRVVQRSWPKGDGAEYATGRTFSITIEAEFDAAESQIIAYEESITIVGNCGPRIEVVELATGAPVLQVLNQKTAQRIIQSGSSIGYGGYVLPFGSLYPTFEHVDRRIEKPGTPAFQGQGYRYYPFQWTYFHSLAIPQTPIPTPR